MDNELTEGYDFTNPEQMTYDAWLFLTNNKKKAKITKEAFVVEIGAMLSAMRDHYILASSSELQLINNALDRVIGEIKSNGEPSVATTKNALKVLAGLAKENNEC